MNRDSKKDKTTNRLYRSRSNRFILGVCGGLGEYFEADPMIFRVLFLFLFVVNGAGILLYLLLALMIPRQPSATDSGNVSPDDLAKDFKSRVQDIAAEVKANESWRLHRRDFIALVIILVGIWMIFRQLFPFYAHWFNWALFWPVVIIMIGLALLLRK